MTDFLKTEALTEPAIFQVYNRDFDAWVTIGTMHNTEITEEVYEKYAEGVDGCALPERCVSHRAVITGNLLTQKSPYLMKYLYQMPVKNEVIGSAKTVTDLEILVDAVASNEQFGAVIPYENWGVGVVDDLIVNDDMGNLLNIGIDYGIKIIHGRTMVVGMVNGAVNQGDTLMVSFEYTPLESIDFCRSGGGVTPPLRVRVLNKTHADTDASEQSWRMILETTADLLSPMHMKFWDCGSDFSTLELLIKLRSCGGAEICTTFQKRA